MEMWEQRISELEDGLLEINQSIKQEQKRLGGKVKASGTCETIPKGLTFVSAESLKEKRMKKYFRKIIAKNLPVLEQDIKLQIQEAQKILRRWTQRKPISEKLYAKWWKLKTKGGKNL